ncbi:MAG: transposase [Chitinophagaceae bacterium]|nr:transposase [Chitinophagaceae bacterium]MBP7316396.1 transposase [Chitinophagaceae bacterium]HQV53984.1 transposase [Chitinophagaceae bacterium]HQX95835.1 transposase [Chitinophagaceae bacterium]HQZ50658.1 transposase [Chitinophagaceae bacterium]
MNIHGTGIYHIYNRGNNQQKIFFNDENYFYFLRKCHTYLKPVCDILAWCLMPNHFHFLIDVTEKSIKLVKCGGIEMTAITNGFRLLQSSYAKGINKQENRTGNLFQQKAKAKIVSGEDNYADTAFHYIHQNPVTSNLVSNPEDWQYSSFMDFVSLRNGTLCNKEKAIELLNLSFQDIKINTGIIISEEKVKNIY